VIAVAAASVCYSHRNLVAITHNTSSIRLIEQLTLQDIQVARDAEAARRLAGMNTGGGGGGGGGGAQRGGAWSGGGGSRPFNMLDEANIW